MQKEISRIIFMVKSSLLFYPKTYIIRHKKENKKKCSLNGLERREDFSFFNYPSVSYPSFDKYILLTMECEKELTLSDASYGLLLLDGTWKYAKQMEDQFIFYPFLKRRLPHFCKTAYPRRQTKCPDPSSGLASIEALAIAYQILGRDALSLLTDYYWKEAFLNQNAQFFK